MTKRYKIADYLNDQIAAAVVRHDAWEPIPALIDNGQIMIYNPRTTIQVDQDEAFPACPLGLYMWLDPNIDHNLDDSTVLQNIALPGTGADVAARVLGLRYEVGVDGGVDDHSVDADNTEDLLRYEDMAEAVLSFMNDWDSGDIPIADLDIAFGLREETD